MRRFLYDSARFGCCVIVLTGALNAQNGKIAVDVTPYIDLPFSSASQQFPPLSNGASVDQIGDYLKVSGELETYRESWIIAVDKNRSIGAPYWPEAFWSTVKEQMKSVDLQPLFIIFLQHAVSKDLMDEVLDTYRTLGRDHFQGSPACFKLGAATVAAQPDFDKLRLAYTQAVIFKVYEQFKPQIKTAHAKYMAEHPDWKDEYQK